VPSGAKRRIRWPPRRATYSTPCAVDAEVEQLVAGLALELLEGEGGPQLALGRDAPDLAAGAVADVERAVVADRETVEEPHAGLVPAELERPARLVLAVGPRRCTWRLP
jgi:hypothetical protein